MQALYPSQVLWGFVIPAAYADHLSPCALPGSDVTVAYTSRDGLYGINDTVSIRVTSTYDGLRYGAISHSSIALETGDIDRLGTYVSHVASTSGYVNYNYKVQEGDYSDDLDYNATNALHWSEIIEGGAVRGLANYWDPENTIACTLPEPGAAGSLADSGAIRVDGIVPRVANVTFAPPDGGYSSGDSIVFNVTFYEAVVYSGAAPVLRVDLGGGATRNAGYSSGNNSEMFTFTYGVQSGDTVSNVDYDGTGALTTAGSLTDLAGNDARLSLSASGATSIDVVGPRVQSTSSLNGTGTYGIGSDIAVTVTFDEDVVVNSTGGTPTIQLETGATDRNATYSAAASTPNVLAFSYTVQRDDDTADLDYTTAAVISLNGGTIRDEADNDAVRTLPPPGTDGLLDSGTIRIDGVRPAVDAVSSTTPPGTYGIGSDIAVTVTFDEDVVVNSTGGTPAIQLETGAIDRNATYSAAASTPNVLAFSYTVQRDDDTADLDYTTAAVISLNGGTIRDEADNDAVRTLPPPGTDGLLDSGTIRIDGVRPAVDAVSSTTPPGTYGIGSDIAVTVTFDEDVVVDTTGGTPAIQLETGAIDRNATYSAAASTPNVLAFSYTVQRDDDTADLDSVVENVPAGSVTFPL